MAKLKTITVTREKTVENKKQTKLEKAAHVAMTDMFGLREGEEVLILTNFNCDGFVIGKALYDAAMMLGGKPVMAIQERKTMFDYMERLAAEALRAEPDIFIGLSAMVRGRDAYGANIGYVGRDGKKYEDLMFKLSWGDRRIRAASGGQLSIDMFERCVPIDYKLLQDRSRKIVDILSRGNEVRLTSPSGTDAILSIKGRRAKADDGNIKFPGAGGNIPSGEAYISPAIEGCSGTFAFDGTITLDNATVIPKKPIIVTMKDGYVDTVNGGEEAKMLLNVIKKGEEMGRVKGQKDRERNARHIGELGIGLNPNAKMTGTLVEDEKLFKTVHVAIGTNLDGDALAHLHLDCLILKPSMWVDGKQVMKDGDLLLG